tara:strand:- start:1145 stop:1903 length:759 start_codon:yes stop_codon:yes gene_type:complete
MYSKLLLLCLLFVISFRSTNSEQEDSSKDLNIKNNIDKTSFDKDANKVIIHVVKSGDNLTNIARKYSIKKEFIIKANKLADENYIYIGQNLVISDKFNTDIYDFDIYKNIYHEIKEGETLTEISNKYKLQINKLIEINNLKNPDLVEVGTKLKLHEDISIKKESMTKSQQAQINLNNTLKNNKYGPLIIKSEKIKLRKGTKLLEATHENGRKIILSLNCETREINVRGIGKKWKGWLPANTKFEKKLLNDFC